MRKKQSPLGKDWAATTSESFMNAARAIEARPSGLVHTMSLAMLAHLINIARPLLCIFGHIARRLAPDLSWQATLSESFSGTYPPGAPGHRRSRRHPVSDVHISGLARKHCHRYSPGL